MSIGVHCPKCGHTVEAPEASLGTVIFCPTCRQRLLLTLPQVVERVAGALREEISVKSIVVTAYVYLGATYSRMGRYASAVEPLREAIRLDPENAEAYYLMGRAFGYLGNRVAALRAQEHLQSLDPDRAAELHTVLEAQDRLQVKHA